MPDEQKYTINEGKIECPYCHKDFDNCGDPMGQGEEQEEQCPHCDKYFDVVCEWEPTYTSTKKEQSEEPILDPDLEHDREQEERAIYETD